MVIFECKRNSLCVPLKRYVPIGARVAQFEQESKVVVQLFPQNRADPFSVLTEGDVRVEPGVVAWFRRMEPPPLGMTRGYFVPVAFREEEARPFVRVMGLPVNSKMAIASTGDVYFKNPTTSLWYHVRINGPDGNVYWEIDQTGVAAPP